MFRRGQKVVCVDISPKDGRTPIELVLNAIYTIRDIYKFDDGAGVSLEEVFSVEEGDFAAEFAAERFRPLVDMKRSKDARQRENA
jgi:hypothetical protein